MPLEYPKHETHAEALTYLVRELNIEPGPWSYRDGVVTLEELIQSLPHDPDIPVFGLVTYDESIGYYAYEDFTDCRALEREIATYAERGSRVVAALNLESSRPMLISVTARTV